MAQRTSKEGIDFIAGWEKFSPRIYLDQGGKETIGYGHLIRLHEPYNENSVLTEAEGMELLKGDLAVAEKAVNTLVKVSLTQNEFDALVSWVFNVGGGNMSTSTLLGD